MIEKYSPVRCLRNCLVKWRTYYSNRKKNSSKRSFFKKIRICMNSKKDLTVATFSLLMIYIHFIKSINSPLNLVRDSQNFYCHERFLVFFLSKSRFWVLSSYQYLGCLIVSMPFHEISIIFPFLQFDCWHCFESFSSKHWIRALPDFWNVETSSDYSSL